MGILMQLLGCAMSSVILQDDSIQPALQRGNILSPAPQTTLQSSGIGVLAQEVLSHALGLGCSPWQYSQSAERSLKPSASHRPLPNRRMLLNIWHPAVASVSLSSPVGSEQPGRAEQSAKKPILSFDLYPSVVS